MKSAFVKDLFSKKEYHTDENTPRYFLDKLMLGGRWYFMWKYIKAVLRTRNEAIKGIYDDDAWIISSFEIIKIVEGCGGKVHIEGLENLYNQDKPIVFISNHMSTLETMIFPGIIAPFMKLTFVIKDSLVKHPFAGEVMRIRNPIVVGRKNPREDFNIVMEQGYERIKSGISILLFPQTTRMVGFNREEFNSLGVKLARKSNARVIPIAIKTNFWQNGKGIMKDLGPINRKNDVYIKFGEAIDIQGNGKQENEKVMDFIEENLSVWK